MLGAGSVSVDGPSAGTSVAGTLGSGAASVGPALGFADRDGAAHLGMDETGVGEGARLAKGLFECGPGVEDAAVEDPIGRCHRMRLTVIIGPLDAPTAGDGERGWPEGAVDDGHLATLGQRLISRAAGSADDYSAEVGRVVRVAMVVVRIRALDGKGVAVGRAGLHIAGVECLWPILGPNAMPLVIVVGPGDRGSRVDLESYRLQRGGDGHGLVGLGRGDRCRYECGKKHQQAGCGEDDRACEGSNGGDVRRHRRIRPRC